MPLPRHLQEQADLADRLLAEASGQPVVPQDTPADSTPADTPTPATTVQVQTPQPAPQPPHDDGSRVWEQRYRTLQGMQQAEARRAQQALQRANELQAQNEEMESRLRSLEQAANARPDEVVQRHSEAFGKDMVQMVQEVAERMFGGHIQQFNNMAREIAELKAVVHGATSRVQQTAQQLMLERLAAEVPNWEAVNKDEGFLLWLSEIDPMSGVQRQQIMNDASSVNSAERVIAVFKAFLAAHPPVVHAPAPNINTQAQPRTAAPAQHAAPAGPTFITQRDIAQFYDDVRRGVYRGRQKEYAAQEAIINQAIAEGRVR